MDEFRMQRVFDDLVIAMILPRVREGGAPSFMMGKIGTRNDGDAAGRGNMCCVIHGRSQSRKSTDHEKVRLRNLTPQGQD
jgi:hypothetical protein